MFTNTIQFTKVYNEVLFDTNLTPTELRVYLVLCAFDIEENGTINNLKYDKMAELSGLSRSRVKQVINKLVEKGYVVKYSNNTYDGEGCTIWNGTRNTYVLPKKITSDRLAKLYAKNRLLSAIDKDSSTDLSTDDEILSPTDEELPLKNDNLCPKGDSISTTTYSVDNTDDDNNIDEHIEKEIHKLKEKEGEEEVSKALAKMENRSISKIGFIAYLKKTINSIKNQGTYKHKNTYQKGKDFYKKPKKESTFNSFPQRTNYNYSNLQDMLLGYMEYNPDLLYT